jgi:hypothetical protein
MFRRELNRDDMIRARIPRRHWQAKLESSQPPVREKVEKYIENMSALESRGVGLLMWGPNREDQCHGSDWQRVSQARALAALP